MLGSVNPEEDIDDFSLNRHNGIILHLAAWTLPPLQRAKQFSCSLARLPLHHNQARRHKHNPSRRSFRPGKKTLPVLKFIKNCPKNMSKHREKIDYPTLWHLFLVTGSEVGQIGGTVEKAPRAAPHLGIAQSDGSPFCEWIWHMVFVSTTQISWLPNSTIVELVVGTPVERRTFV